MVTDDERVIEREGQIFLKLKDEIDEPNKPLERE